MEVVVSVPHFTSVSRILNLFLKAAENPTSPHYCIASCMSCTLQPFIRGGLCAVVEFQFTSELNELVTVGT